MTITIDADDPRTIRAIEIASEAQHWLTGRNAAGQDVYGIPSQADPGHYYIVTTASCDCPDFRNSESAAAGRDRRACKHMLAVRLHRELVRAQQRPARSVTQRNRGHLSVVHSSDR